jgi:methylmalonyl-CoA mutase cobalamin-binding domain/chain
MDDHGLYIASLLDTSARALAAGTASRLDELYGEVSAGASFSELRADTEVRIAHLAESLAAGAPELFASHVSWLRDAYAARGVDLDRLQGGLKCLRDELEASLQPDVHEAVFAQIEAGLDVLREPAVTIESTLSADAPHAELCRNLMLALLEGRRDDALALIEDAVAAGTPVSALETDVVGRVLKEIGHLWQRGELRVGEEHIGSSIVEEILALLARYVPRVSNPERRAVVASVPGNAHDLGLRIIRDHLSLAGWDTVFLGANTPAEEVVWSVGEFDVQLVALSTALPTHVRATAVTIAALRAHHPDVLVLAGGAVFGQAPELYRAVGADACAVSADEAVREAGRLLPTG